MFVLYKRPILYLEKVPTMPTIEVKLCLACGKAVKGRIDKKFCDDSCRNNHNNQLKAEQTNYVRNVMNALRRNRLILQHVWGDKMIRKATLDRLLGMGFQLKYHTHFYDNKKGRHYYYCFDYGYLPIDDEVIWIVKKKTDTN